MSNILFYLMLFAVIIPVFLGLIRFYWRALFAVVDNPLNIFYYFGEKKRYIKCLKITFAVIIKALPVCVILYIPYLLVWLVTQNFTYDIFNITMPLWTANLSNVAIILHIFADITIKLYFLKFYIVPVLFAANEDMSISDIINMSRILSYKSAVDFIFLILSLLFWLALSLFILPLIFTMPYILLSFTVHTKGVISEYNEHINSLKLGSGYYEAVG